MQMTVKDSEIKIVTKKIYDLIKDLEEIKKQEEIIEKQLMIFRMKNEVQK
ncbi:MAG: hypothetical protein ACTSRP_09140 [Candidatus Helarchaeota archaeon]